MKYQSMIYFILKTNVLGRVWVRTSSVPHDDLSYTVHDIASYDNDENIMNVKGHSPHVSIHPELLNGTNNITCTGVTSTTCSAFVRISKTSAQQK